MRNIRRWILDTEVKVFHISWNDPETVFHEMFWKKNFTVYPSLYTYNNTVCINYFGASALHIFHFTNSFLSITQLKQ